MSALLKQFREEFDFLPVVLWIGEYRIRNISRLTHNDEFAKLISELINHIDSIFSYNLDQENLWPRLISEWVDIDESGIISVEKYIDAFENQIESLWSPFEYNDLGKGMLASLYFYIYPSELRYAKKILHNGEYRMKIKFASEYWDAEWRRKFSNLMMRHKKVDALKLINKLIENTLPLFGKNPEILEERRMAWLFKIDLLLELGRISEALAWTCLECEISPNNITALALKRKLLNELDLVIGGQNIYPDNSLKNISKPPIHWQGLAGMRELKAAFEEEIILPLQDPSLYEKYKIPIPNGILLYGPPGCGKTYFVRTAARHIDYHFIEVKASDLASTFVHGTQKQIGQLFKEAEANAPSLILLDELDAFVPNRSRGDVSYHYSAEVNEFLSQLNECSQRKILVVGTTNLIDKIDTAILRPGRFDKNIFVSTPDPEARLEAFKMFMVGRPQGKIDWIRLVEYSDCYTFAEIKHVVIEAAKQAFKMGKNISTDDLLDALISNPATLTFDQIEMMRKKGNQNIK